VHEWKTLCKEKKPMRRIKHPEKTRLRREDEEGRSEKRRSEKLCTISRPKLVLYEL